MSISQICQLYLGKIQKCLRGTLKKTNSIFKDMVHIGGREVNPISKNLKRNDVLTKVGEGGGHTTNCQK